MDGEDIVGIAMVCILGGFVIGGFLFDVIFAADIEISQETADDVCKQLTNDSTAVAENTQEQTLICKLPSFDSTQNIIFKLNSEE